MLMLPSHILGNLRSWHNEEPGDGSFPRKPHEAVVPTSREWPLVLNRERPRKEPALAEQRCSPGLGSRRLDLDLADRPGRGIRHQDVDAFRVPKCQGSNQTPFSELGQYVVLACQPD